MTDDATDRGTSAAVDRSWGAALASVRRAYETFERRAYDALEASRMQAGNVLRPAIEAVVAVPRATAGVLEGLTEAAAKRVEAAAARAESAARRCSEEAGGLQRAWDAARAAADAQRAADVARADADRAMARKDALATVRAGFAEVVAVERRTRYLRALALAAPALALVFGLGMLAEHWRASAAAVRSAAAELDRLQATARSAGADLHATRHLMQQATVDMRTAVTEAGSGLAVLRAIGDLPPAEMAAAQEIVAELANSRQRGAALAAVREAMALPPGPRRQGVEFARIGDVGLRASFLAIAQTAAARTTQFWQGEEPYRGCLANGPTLPTTAGTTVSTCLIELPVGWPAKPDHYLRAYYRGTEARR